MLTAARWQAIQAGTDGEPVEDEVDDLEGTDFYGDDEEQEETVSVPITRVEKLRSASISANQAVEVEEDEELEEEEEYLDDEVYEDEEEGDEEEEYEDDEEYEYEDEDEEEYDEEE